MTPPPVRPIDLSQIRAARERIAGTILRTPLVRLELGPGFPDIAKNWRTSSRSTPTSCGRGQCGRAALSRSGTPARCLDGECRNAGQGVAYAARAAGVPCSVVVIETAPAAKMERMRALGAKLIPVPYEVACAVGDAIEGVEGTLVHPFDDHNFIAGPCDHGLGDSGGRTRNRRGYCGDRRRWPSHRRGQCDQGAATQNQDLGRGTGNGEPGARQPVLRRGLATGLRELEPSFVDGAGRPSVFPLHVGKRMKPVVDGYLVVSLEETRRAMRMMAEKARVIARAPAPCLWPRL